MNDDAAVTSELVRTMSRRRMLAGVVVAPALAGLLAACGSASRNLATGSSIDTSSDSIAPTDTTTPGSTATSIVALPPITHPNGVDDVVLRVAYTGGLTTPWAGFANAPTLMITGDGRLITPGVVPAIYPGPLLPALDERSISEAGITRVLNAAAAAHLLQTPPDYSAELMVADAPDTEVVISANGGTFDHHASALGFDHPGPDTARGVLAAFVDAVSDIATMAGAENLGASAPLVATKFRITSHPVTPSELASASTAPGPTPDVMPWPETATVRLADAAACTVIDAATVGTALAHATQLTYFADAGVTYAVYAIALLPGDRCGA